MGVTLQAVMQAIKKGRLKESLVRDEKGKLKIRNVALAQLEWSRTTDNSRSPGYVKQRVAERESSLAMHPRADVGDEGFSLAAESAREKYWKASIAELDFKKKAGELINAKEMTDKIVNVFTICRTKLLGIPTRAKMQLPHLSASDVAMLDDLVREVLEELSLSALNREEETENEL